MVLINQKHLTWSDIGDGNTLRVSIKGDEDNDLIAFRTDNSERMRLTNTGLGIGTSSPSEKLTLKASSSTEVVFGIQYSSVTLFRQFVGALLAAARQLYLHIHPPARTSRVLPTRHRNVPMSQPYQVSRIEPGNQSLQWNPRGW